MTRVLVTGGAGFIGSHVVERLLAAGVEVAVLDNLSTGRRENVPAHVRFYQVDLRDRDTTLRVLETFRPEAVNHQAAQASVVVSMREPRFDAEVNLLGGLNLLDASVATGVQRFVFASTGGAICGEVAAGERAREDCVPKPISPYAIHKLAFEQLLSVYQTHRDIETSVLRYANVYGPRQDPHGEAGVIAIFLDSVLAGRTLCVNGLETAGDPGCVRDYVYVTDVARMNELALRGELEERLGNVCTGVGTTTRELAEAVMRATGRSVELEGRPPRAGDIGMSVLDPTLPERYLGALVGLEQGLKHTADWVRESSGAA